MAARIYKLHLSFGCNARNRDLGHAPRRHSTLTGIHEDSDRRRLDHLDQNTSPHLGGQGHVQMVSWVQVLQLLWALPWQLLSSLVRLWNKPVGSSTPNQWWTFTHTEVNRNLHDQQAFKAQMYGCPCIFRLDYLWLAIRVHTIGFRLNERLPQLRCDPNKQLITSLLRRL